MHIKYVCTRSVSHYLDIRNYRLSINDPNIALFGVANPFTRQIGYLRPFLFEDHGRERSGSPLFFSAENFLVGLQMELSSIDSCISGHNFLGSLPIWLNNGNQRFQLG